MFFRVPVVVQEILVDESKTFQSADIADLFQSLSQLLNFNRHAKIKGTIIINNKVQKNKIPPPASSS